MFGASNNSSSSATPASGLFGGFKPQTSANLFGSTPAPTAGLFGASNNQTGSNGNLFASTTTTSTPQPGGSLFGSTTNNPTPQPNSTNLFGSNTNNNQASGSLFGSTATPQTGGTTTNLFGSNPTTQTGGNLFGSNTNNTTTQNGGSIFGSTTNNPAPQQTNLFGSNTNNSTNNQAGGGLFGSTTNNSNTQTNLFGSTTNNSTTPQQNTNTPASNLFGNSNQNTSSNLFGNSLNNQPNSSSTGNLFQSSTNANLGSSTISNSFGNKSSSVPVTPATSGVSQSNPVFTRTTRFNDLPDDVKKQLEMLDTMIQTQCRHSDNLKAMQLGTEITEGTSLLRQVTSEMHATSASVATSTNLLDSIRQAIDTDVGDLLKLAAIVDAHLTQRLTAVGATTNTTTTTTSSLNSSESLPLNPIKFQQDFFSQKCLEMQDRVKRYRQTIEFVELQLKGLFDRPSPASIVPALKAQYSTFMALADKVAQLNTTLISLKEEYREIWRHQTGSVRDPFAEVDRLFGLVGPTSNSIHFQPC